MAQRSSIEWTECTWNPLTGCTKISPGCAHCYAERMARRLKAMGQPRYRNGFRLTIHNDLVAQPLHWRIPRSIFVNSMSDLFHKGVPLDFIVRIFGAMKEASHHRFQVLTKRSHRLAEVADQLPWPENVWMGVSIENDAFCFRAKHLKSTGARIKFISLEPLLGPVPSLELRGIDWVIVGGESGPGARPMSQEWVVHVRDLCRACGGPVLFQAVGRRAQERGWPDARRPDVGRNAGRIQGARRAYRHAGMNRREDVRRGDCRAHH